MTAITQIALGTYPGVQPDQESSLMLKYFIDQDTNKELIKTRQEAINAWLADQANCLISTVQTTTTTDTPGTNILYNGTAYFITNDGQRRPYTSAGAFLSYGFNSFANTDVILDKTNSNLSLPVGAFIPPRDGKIICSNKGSDIGTCYLITNSQKAGFTSAAVFKGLGFSFNDTTPGDVSWMTATNPISSATSAHLPGVLINKNGTYELVTTNGFIGIPDANTLQSWGYSFSDAVMANSADKLLSQSSVLTTKQAGQLHP
jgi:hypothetical protein